MLPDYAKHHSWPKYDPKPLKSIAPRLSKPGLDLLGQLLQHDPAMRIPAKDALMHPYFNDIRAAKKAARDLARSADADSATTRGGA